MHIPDRYLGPETYGAAYAVMLPFWGVASAKLKKTLRTRQAPLLALGAAFSFVIMMFNVPIPGGSTGHAVGAVLLAVLLGPWAACIALTIVLAVQALFFGDGGVTAFAANCINMAVIMPFTGYWVYNLASGRSEITSKRRAVAAGIAGYVGLNVAAIGTAFMFGIQPYIARDALGRPLYAPYPLKVAVPVMALEHLFVFGFVEAIVTTLVLGYLQRTEPSLLDAASGETGRRSRKRLAVGLSLLVLLSPLGLILPAKFGAGSAWGEWSGDELHRLVGYLPQSFSKPEPWSAPMPDYAPKGLEDAGLSQLSISYIASGVLGALLVLAATLTVIKLLGRGQGSGMRKSFWRRTISGMGQTLKREFIAFESAARDGFLQRIDPRIKLPAVLIMVVGITLLHSIYAILLCLGTAFMLAVSSRVNLRAFTGALVPVMLLTTLLALPSMLNIVTPGRALASFQGLSITDSGLYVAARFIAGAAACAAWMSLLTLTTRWTSLLTALQALRIPGIFILTLQMMYRFMFVLIRDAEQMHLAKESRTITAEHPASGRSWVAGRAGDMFVRTRRLSDQVHISMTARGFTGEARSLTKSERSKR